jgi:hypothetical protein
VEYHLELNNELRVIVAKVILEIVYEGVNLVARLYTCDLFAVIEVAAIVDIFVSSDLQSHTKF